MNAITDRRFFLKAGGALTVAFTVGLRPERANLGAMKRYHNPGSAAATANKECNCHGKRIAFRP